MAGGKPDSTPFWALFLPFLSWIGELKDKETLRADLIAGVTVALVLVPQSMAYAQLAGLPVYYGLYASFLPPMVAALFGSSRQLATGRPRGGSIPDDSCSTGASRGWQSRGISSICSAAGLYGRCLPTLSRRVPPSW